MKHYLLLCLLAFCKVVGAQDQLTLKLCSVATETTRLKTLLASSTAESGIPLKQQNNELTSDFLNESIVNGLLVKDAEEAFLKVRMRLFKSDQLVVKQLCVRTSEGIFQPTRELFPKKRQLINRSGSTKGNFRIVVENSMRSEWLQFSSVNREVAIQQLNKLREVKREMRWHPFRTRKQLSFQCLPFDCATLDTTSLSIQPFGKGFKRLARQKRDALKQQSSSLKQELRVIKRRFNKKAVFKRRFTIHYKENQ